MARRRRPTCAARAAFALSNGAFAPEAWDPDGAASLPKLYEALPRQPPLASPLREQSKWPIPPIGCQSRANRILKHIVHFLLEILIVSQPMLKKIPLPTDAIPVRGPMFPVTNAFVNHRLLGKTQNKVDMIGHDCCRVRPPVTFTHSVGDGIKEALCNGRLEQWLLQAIDGAAGDEKNRTADINPNWNLMRQGSATGFHPANISKSAYFTEEKTSRRRS
jgi:hypothetical protein